jgi:hypothetical protein
MRDAQAVTKRTPSQIKRNPTLDLIEQVVAEEEGLDIGRYDLLSFSMAVQDSVQPHQFSNTNSPCRSRIAPIEDDLVPSGNDAPVEGRRSFSLAELAAFAASKVATALPQEPQPASEETPPPKQRPPPLEVLHAHESRDDIGTPNSAAIREAQLSSAQVINETSAQVARIQYVPRKTGIRIRAIHHVGDSMQFSDDEVHSISAGLEDDHDEHDEHEDPEPTPVPAFSDAAKESANNAIPSPPPPAPASFEASGATDATAQTDSVPPPPPPPPAPVTAAAEEVPPPPPPPLAADVQPAIRAVENIEAATQAIPPPPPPPPPPAAVEAEAADAAAAAVDADAGAPSKADAPEEIVQAAAAVSAAAVVEEPADACDEEHVAKRAPAVTRQKSETTASGPPKLRRPRNNADAAPEQTPEEPKGKPSRSKPGPSSNPPQLSRRVVAAPKASSNSKKCGYLQWKNNATAEWILQW